MPDDDEDHLASLRKLAGQADQILAQVTLKAVEDAIAIERERCAKIVERTQIISHQQARAIATAIRHPAKKNPAEGRG